MQITSWRNKFLSCCATKWTRVSKNLKNIESNNLNFQKLIFMIWLKCLLVNTREENRDEKI